MPKSATRFFEKASSSPTAQRPVWGRIVFGWGFGDFIFNTETNVLSDVNNIYEYEFTERMNLTVSLLNAIGSLERQRILP